MKAHCAIDAGGADAGRWKRRILVVDDDVFVRDVLVKFFSMNGYETLSAESAEEALEVMRENGASSFDCKALLNKYVVPPNSPNSKYGVPRISTC